MKKWKIIFWIAGLSFALQIINVPLSKNPGLSDTIGMLITGFTLVPLYGFAYKIAIGTRTIAIAIFLINFVILVFSIYWLVLYTMNHISMVQLFFSGFALFVALLFFYPVFAYAFKSKEIWSSNA